MSSGYGYGVSPMGQSVFPKGEGEEVPSYKGKEIQAKARGDIGEGWMIMREEEVWRKGK